MESGGKIVINLKAKSTGRRTWGYKSRRVNGFCQDDQAKEYGQVGDSGSGGNGSGWAVPREWVNLSAIPLAPTFVVNAQPLELSLLASYPWVLASAWPAQVRILRAVWFLFCLWQWRLQFLLYTFHG